MGTAYLSDNKKRIVAVFTNVSENDCRIDLNVSSLNSSNVKFDNVKVMATPRRLAVIVDGLASSQPDVEKVVKGPIATVAFDENKNLTRAGEGFANKNRVVLIFSSQIWCRGEMCFACGCVGIRRQLLFSMWLFTL